MATDIISREQRLRKQAELQSLYTALANLREREASYIETSANIPELFLNQIKDIRHKIRNVENELLTLEDDTANSPVESSAQKFYQQAFEAESNGDFAKAVKLYRNAARYGHPDGSAAGRSVRYLSKATKDKPAANMWIPKSAGRSRSRFFIGLVAFLIFVLIVVVAWRGRSPAESQEAIAIASTDTVTPTQTPIYAPIPTATATNTPIPTSTPTLLPTHPPQPVPTEALLTDTLILTITPTLRAAPKIIGPRDGLVWSDGAIVFEFEKLDLAYDQLYCLNTLRGYDINNAENWSYVSVGRKTPYIAIEPNAFHVARSQGIRCFVWSAFIGQETCANVISESTLERIVGLPRPCDFKNR